MTTLKTAQARRWELRQLHITGPAAEMILRREAPLRHEERTRRVLEVAKEYVRERVVPFPDRPCDDALAAASFAVDLVGVGGSEDLEGTASERLPIFESLGKGRKQAVDGPAWTAAMTSALRSVFPAGIEFTTSTDSSRVYAVGMHGDLLAEVPIDMLGLPKRWLRAVASIGLLCSIGQCPRPDLLPDVRFDGENAERWAIAVNLQSEGE